MLNSFTLAILVAATINNVIGFSFPTPTSSRLSTNLQMAPFFASELNDKSSKTTVIAGATGYIGKSTVRESVRQGYNTIALVRDAKKVTSAEGKALYGQFFDGAKVVECDVCDPEALTKVCSLNTVYYFIAHCNHNHHVRMVFKTHNVSLLRFWL